jgi:hypothetical protein
VQQLVYEVSHCHVRFLIVLAPSGSAARIGSSATCAIVDWGPCRQQRCSDVEQLHHVFSVFYLICSFF